jgi:hypothetical protein
MNYYSSKHEASFKETLSLQKKKTSRPRFSRQKASPPEATKSKSPERSGLQLDVFWEAALTISKTAAVEVRLSSESLALA